MALFHLVAIHFRSRMGGSLLRRAIRTVTSVHSPNCVNVCLIAIGLSVRLRRSRRDYRLTFGTLQIVQQLPFSWLPDSTINFSFFTLSH